MAARRVDFARNRAKPSTAGGLACRAIAEARGDGGRGGRKTSDHPTNYSVRAKARCLPKRRNEPADSVPERSFAGRLFSAPNSAQACSPRTPTSLMEWGSTESLIERGSQTRVVSRFGMKIIPSNLHRHPTICMPSGGYSQVPLLQT